jgi:transposase
VIDACLVLSTEREAQLRQELKKNDSVPVYRRAAALLAIHQGSTVNDVARLLGVTRQTIYNWIDTYGAADKVCDLEDADRPGRPSIWTPELQATLDSALNPVSGRSGCGTPDWTVSALRAHLEADTGKRISETALRKKLELMGYMQKRHRYIVRSSPPQQPQKPQVPGLNWGLVPRPQEVERKDKLIAA